MNYEQFVAMVENINRSGIWKTQTYPCSIEVYEKIIQSWKET